MKRLLLVLLLLISTPAWAVWTRIGGIDEFDYYIDRARILKIGNTVRMWTLFDFKTKPRTSLGLPYVSVRVQDEFDCDKERFRSLASVFYARNMGSGEIVDTNSKPSQWDPVPPRTYVEDFLKIACGKE